MHGENLKFVKFTKSCLFITTLCNLFTNTWFHNSLGTLTKNDNTEVVWTLRQQKMKDAIDKKGGGGTGNIL